MEVAWESVSALVSALGSVTFFGALALGMKSSQMPIPNSSCYLVGSTLSLSAVFSSIGRDILTSEIKEGQ